MGNTGLKMLKDALAADSELRDKYQEILDRTIAEGGAKNDGEVIQKVAAELGFSDTVLGDRFPSVLEEHLGDITLRGYYHDVVKTTLMDLITKNPECKACEHLAACGGGCMLESITEEGDFLVPDQSACWFHKHVGEAGVREAAAEGIRASRASSSPLEGRRV